MKKELDTLNLRSLMNVPEIDIERFEEDSAHMEEERCCGNCCWFCFEDTDGNGCCLIDYPDGVTCDKKACKSDFVSRREMRHHMAVLLQHTRIYENPAIRHIPTSKECNQAYRFAYKYMKVFGKI